VTDLPPSFSSYTALLCLGSRVIRVSTHKEQQCVIFLTELHTSPVSCSESPHCHPSCSKSRLMELRTSQSRWGSDHLHRHSARKYEKSKSMNDLSFRGTK
jgi:hypothetical protein